MQGNESRARRVLLLAGLGGALGGMNETGWSQIQTDYPSRTVKFLVPATAGSGVDILTRAMADVFRTLTKVPTVVENKGGANGAIGATAYFMQPPDGYTLLNVTSSLMNLVPMTQKVPYSTDQLRTVFGMSRHSGMFLASLDSGFKTLAEAVDTSKHKPESINFGTYSTHFQLAMASFQKMSGARFNPVPYRGIDAFSGLIDGSLQILLADLGTSLKYVRAGKMVPLAAATDVRHPDFPTVPTVEEAGYARFEVYEVSGFAVHADTPDPIVRRIEELLMTAGGTPEFAELAKRLPGAQMTRISGKDFGRLLADRRQQQKELMDSLGGLKL